VDLSNLQIWLINNAGSFLDKYFEKKVTIPRVRRGEHQEIETLIGEEALLFAGYLRDEKPTWHPRIVSLS
jgi:hypothetical protein